MPDLRHANKFAYLFVLIFCLESLSSCGDLLSRRKNIFGNYYLAEEDGTNNIAIYYKTSTGDLIQRVPGKVIEYGVLDSLLIAKKSNNGKIEFYIINTKDDFEFAEQHNYLIGIQTDEEFKRRHNKSLDFTKAKF